MKITLKETGGLVGKTKTAAVDFDITDDEYKALIKKISITPKSKLKKTKDAFSYFLSKNGEVKATTISISNIPGEYNLLFDELFQHLKVEK